MAKKTVSEESSIPQEASQIENADQEEAPEEYKPGVGLDVGTSFLQVSRRRLNGKVSFISQRDAYYEIRPASSVNAKLIERSLRHRNAFYLKKENRYYIIGTSAIDIANERQHSVERPLKSGVLSAKDRNSFGMLSVILESLLKKASIEGEQCYYSVPANPIDMPFDNVYHENVLNRILTNLGYAPTSLLEAEALVYSELLDEDLTGCTISCGAGMTNVAISHLGSNVLSFSIAKGGDFIDSSVAIQLGLPDSIVQAEKEAGLNLFEPNGDIQEGLSIYYNSLIKYIVDNLEYKLKLEVQKIPKFKDPIVVVISGGTSLAGGFLTKFEEALFEKILPFEVKEIRSAGDPMTAVANGCLIASQL